MDLTIAVVAPMQGGEAIVALPMLGAVRAAVRDHGPIFGGRVGVRALDDGRDPQRAAEAVARLIDDPDVIGVIGPMNSGSALAVRDVVEAAGLPLLLPAATAVELAGAGCMLRLCATDDDVARAATAFIQSRGGGPVCVESDETPYGTRLAGAVLGVAGANRLEVTGNPDGARWVFLAMGETEQAMRIRQLRSAGYAGQLLGAEGGPGRSVGRLAAGEADGAWQLYPGAPLAGHERAYTAEATAATQALLQAYDATLDRTRIADWLRSAVRPPVRTALGAMQFDADGQRAGTAVSLWRIRDGNTGPCLPLESTRG